MTEKNLITKLHNAKKLSPDTNWLESNRELFLSQISNTGADKLTAWQVFSINFKSLAKASSQPALASFVFLLVLVATSIFGHKFFSQAKPNDSLYIARVISEKAKLNTVLDSEARDKMAVKFATNHAKDISEVLSNPEFNNNENKERVDKLSETFDKEIETVKNRMESLSNKQSENEARENAKKPEAPKQETNTEEATLDNPDNNYQSATSTNDDESVSIAAEGDLKDENGIEIDIKRTDEDDVVTLEEVDTLTTTSTNTTTSSSSPEGGSTTEEIAEALLEKVENGKEKIDSTLIEEAKSLFKEQKYSEVIERLNKISELLNK